MDCRLLRIRLGDRHAEHIVTEKPNADGQTMMSLQWISILVTSSFLSSHTDNQLPFAPDCFLVSTIS